MIAFGDFEFDGQTLLADKGYRRASFETELNTAGITLIRPALTSEPDPASPHAYSNASSPSPPRSGTTKPPTETAPPAHSPPTTTDPLEPII